MISQFASTHNHLSVESAKLNEFWSYKDMLSYFTHAQTKGEYHLSALPTYVYTLKIVQLYLLKLSIYEW